MKARNSALTLRWVLLLLGVALAVRQWVWMPGIITGESMQPTLRSGQLVGINKLAYRFDRPKRGEIVYFWTGGEYMVKRILGLPGEQIALRDGTFYVNGAPMAEPYVQFKDHSNIADGRLGPGCFVVSGDNRSQSLTAVVNRSRIVGRVQPQRYAAQVAAIIKSP